MKKIILDLTASLDGYIEGPNGEIDWIRFSNSTFDYLLDFIRGIDAVIYGRVSFELWGNYRPGNEASPEQREFYRQLHNKRKYVFTSRKENRFEGAETVSDGPEHAVERIKASVEQDIWLYGGSALITDFVNHNLINEYRIAIQPAVLGAGKPLFKDINRPLHLELERVMNTDEGVVGLVYRPRD